MPGSVGAAGVPGSVGAAGACRAAFSRGGRVPAWFTFADLHQAIQASFLWWDYHMYDFRLRTGGRDLMLVNPRQGGVDATFAPYPGKWGTTDDASLRLGEVFPRTRKVLSSYDYGDGWDHTIKYVGKVDDYDGSLPICTDGEGDAPPEDVGSLPGFEHFLEVIEEENDPRT